MVFMCSKPCIFVHETVFSKIIVGTLEFLGGLRATKGAKRTIFLAKVLFPPGVF
jgi:hypothetical protein